MECTCTQTKLPFILSSERVLENGVRIHVKGKIPLPEAQRRVEPATLHHHTGQQAQHATDWAILTPNCILWVSNQNGVSLLYTEGFRPEPCISTICWGFPTRMVYLYYISRVPDQNGVSLLYIEGFPRYHAWDTPFWSGTLNIKPAASLSHGILTPGQTAP